ncbi:MAG TPA: cyclase family protein [Candidatus Cryosericum sp.]|nr:cyclase family protein [Candidatus Cryosericum sp.]
MIHDISPPITPDLKVWPGDVPPHREVQLDMRRGDHLTLSALRTSVHVGAHADAPSHYGAQAPDIGARPLDLYLGPCQVVRLEARRGESLPPAALRGLRIRAPRVLFATGTFPDPTVFNEDFAAFSPETIDRLHLMGVRLVGTDTPSIDLFASKDLPAHQACLHHDMAILEGLVLDRVAEGIYELIALPLPLVGYDGSPVRAVLRDLPPSMAAEAGVRSERG